MTNLPEDVIAYWEHYKKSLNTASIAMAKFKQTIDPMVDHSSSALQHVLQMPSEIKKRQINHQQSPTQEKNDPAPTYSAVDFSVRQPPTNHPPPIVHSSVSSPDVKKTYEEPLNKMDCNNYENTEKVISESLPTPEKIQKLNDAQDRHITSDHINDNSRIQVKRKTPSPLNLYENSANLQVRATCVASFSNESITNLNNQHSFVNENVETRCSSGSSDDSMWRPW